MVQIPLWLVHLAVSGSHHAHINHLDPYLALVELKAQMQQKVT